MSTAKLQAYALANYERGGHWIYETYTPEDYEAVLIEAEGDIERAQAALRDIWDMYNERELDCSW